MTANSPKSTGLCMLQIKTLSGFGSRPLLRLTGMLLLLAHALPLWAAPSQSPLINRAENKPRPNFMLTLDDSGSMNYQYMPERNFVLTWGPEGRYKETIPFPTDARVYMHPDEPAINTFTRNNYKDVHFVAADISSSPADWTILPQIQMRSPQVNSIYYNPAVKYKPWVDALGQSFKAATPSKAYFDPLVLAPGVTPAVSAVAADLTTTKAPTARWFCSTLKDTREDPSPCQSTTKSYNPAIVYILDPNLPPNNPSSYTLYNLNSTSTKNFTYPGKYTQRSDCTVSGTSTVCSQAAELDNYANWFVFYRSRLLLAQGAIPAAFGDVNDSIRLGWGTIHAGSYTVDSETESIVQKGVRNLDTSHKGAFFDWLRSRSTESFTPNREALEGVGRYFQREDNGSPWSSDPGARSATKLSCRRSYNILVTDGYYNDSYSGVGNFDANRNAAPYNVYPFRDSESNTLADIAMYYWATDLQPKVDNEVVKTDSTESPYKSDPATWQHLTQFTVGLGVTGTMPTTVAQLDSLALCGKAGGTCWSTDLIDDLWHAAVNSRGDYFSATDADSLTSALQQALRLGSESIQKEAGVATAAATLVTNNIKFVPQYQPINWTGNILAYSLNSSGIASTNATWDAESRLPSPDARNIVIRDTGSSSTVAFTKENYKNFSAPLIKAMGSQASANLVDYLRGNSPDDGIPRRSRKALLPDFVNSTPLFVKGGFDLGYTKLAADNATTAVGAGTYSAYLSNKAARTNGALFIGGNGGMLHVFDEAGVEQFGFVPYAGVGNLYKLARRDYGSAANFHQFFVDGPLVESDAYLTSGDIKSWTNVVVGTMGAGGRSVFALRLNTSNPSSLDAGSVLWEVNGPADSTGTGTERDDIGYITSEPQVAMLPNGQWKVFVGNGLDSQSGRAALLVIDLESGAVDSVVVGGAAANGLGGVRLVKSDTTNAVLAAYAGDATGKLWRFEYTSSTGKMTAAYGGSPLMTATDSQGAAQAITATPVVRSHPNGGNIVVFGTGRLFNDADSGTTQTQTLYGVWDKVKETETSAAHSVPIPGGSSLRAEDSLLVNQLISGPTVVTQVDAEGNALTVVDASGNTVSKTDTFYQVSSKVVDWGTKKGWLLDLNMPTGGSTVDRPRVIDALQTLGESVYITALTPAPNAGETCGPNQTAKGYAFLLKLLDGAQQTVPSFDTDGNSIINGNDIVSAGMSTPAGPQIIVRRESPLEFETGAGPDKSTYDCDLGSAQNAVGGRGAQDCRKRNITTPPLRVLDRTWRQLLNPPAP